MTRREEPRILVVDDDPDICDNLSDILSDLGYQVDTAHDGPAALELVSRQPYDVALLDLKMPGMDGLTLYREIKKQRAGTVSLLVTAFAGPPRPRKHSGPVRGKYSPSQWISPSCCTWWRKRSTNHWSWSSTTTATSAKTSGTCFATAASAFAWPMTCTTRPKNSESRRSRSS